MPEPEPHAFSRQAEKLIADFRRIPDDSPDRMRKRPTRSVGGVVEELRIRYRIGREAPEDAIRTRWADIVGPVSAERSHVARLAQNGVSLVVLSDDAVVRSELIQHRHLILEKLRSVPGCAGLKTLLVRAG